MNNYCLVHDNCTVNVADTCKFVTTLTRVTLTKCIVWFVSELHGVQGIN